MATRSSLDSAVVADSGSIYAGNGMPSAFGRSVSDVYRFADRRENLKQLAQPLGGQSSVDWARLLGYQAKSAVRLAGDRGSGRQSMHSGGIDTCYRGKVDH